MTNRGQWHGKKYYFGMHYDIHANTKDTDIGTRCSPRDLVPIFKLMKPDFVQTDCKGHAGYTSWFSKVPTATVSPGVVKDALQGWRVATRKLGLPLHCHYSGVWDKAAGAKYPDWCVKGPDGKPPGNPPVNEKMCMRGPYLDELMIPQLKELIDRYDVDGFWVDGELWGVEPCYCERCRKEFTARTGIAEPPTKETDPNWSKWWNFNRESFEEYVTRYCDAVHKHKPGVLVCSNWLQSFKNPGEPKVPTDWISGDNVWMWGLDGSRCEARFLSTRGKPWDIMLWSFYCAHGQDVPESPWTSKPVEMLQQEAAVILAFGGRVQIYETTPELRNGQLAPWRMKRLGQVGRFVKRRQALCQVSETIPQIAVLHSEHHIHATVSHKNLIYVDVSPVQGVVFSLLEHHYGLDVLDEWAMLPRLNEFPVVVAPEQDAMSQTMVNALKKYVENGGKLLVTGAKSLERFGADFLGVTPGKVEEKKKYFVPAADGSVPIFSTWRLVELAGATSLGQIGTSTLMDERMLPYPAATLHKFGRGMVAYIPASVFHDFTHNRYPLTREFIGKVMRSLAGRMSITVDAPISIDVALRKQGRKNIIHLINRSTGIPNQANSGVIDEIPNIGPIKVTMKLPSKPRKVSLAFENAPLKWKYRGNRLSVDIPHVRIHAALVVE